MIVGKVVDSNLLFPLYVSKIYVTTTQILALFATAVQIVPAAPGFIHVVEKVVWNRELGTAYTLNGATKLKITYLNAAGTAIAHTFDATLLSDPGPFSVISNGPSSLSTQFASATFSSTALNQPLVVGMDTAQVTVGTGGVFVTCFYRSFQTPFSMIS